MAGCGIVQDRRHRYLLASAAWDKGIAPAVPEVLLVDGIRWGSVGPLLFISLVIMGSPGPATISLMAAGSAYGVRRSLSYLIGIVVGTTIVLLAVATGITAALLAVPAIGSILIWISVAYILWLRTTSRPHRHSRNRPQPRARSRSRGERSSASPTRRPGSPSPQSSPAATSPTTRQPTLPPKSRC